MTQFNQVQQVVINSNKPVVILKAPKGSGKTFLCKFLMKDFLLTETVTSERLIYLKGHQTFKDIIRGEHLDVCDSIEYSQRKVRRGRHTLQVLQNDEFDRVRGYRNACVISDDSETMSHDMIHHLLMTNPKKMFFTSTPRGMGWRKPIYTKSFWFDRALTHYEYSWDAAFVKEWGEDNRAKIYHDNVEVIDANDYYTGWGL